MTIAAAEQPDTPAKKGFGSVVLIVFLAALVRVGWAALVPMASVSDCAIYDGAARRLAKGMAYTIDEQSTSPSAHWPVGTSFMYSLVYRAFDPEKFGYMPIVVLNIAISLAVVVLAIAAAWKWFGRTAAIGTGLIMALWPMHIEFTTVIGSEPIFTAFILGGMLAWPACPRRRRDAVAEETSGSVIRSIPLLIISGLCFGAATYMRPTSLLFPVILAGIDFLRTGRLVLPVVRAAIAGVILLLTLLPWSIRNHHVFGKFILVSTNGGTNMWMGNNPDTTGVYMPPPAPDPGANEATWDKELGRRAIEYIKQDPKAFAKRSALKAVKLHDRETIGVAWNKDGLQKVSATSFDPKTGFGTKALKALSSGYWYLVLAAGAIGAIVLAARSGPWKALTHPTVILFAYFTGVHAIMVIQDRYHFPITPLVAALASLTLGRLLSRRAAMADTEASLA